MIGSLRGKLIGMEGLSALIGLMAVLATKLRSLVICLAP